eukprot:166116-Alexandrium_andersonii.AAC.1
MQTVRRGVCCGTLRRSAHVKVQSCMVLAPEHFSTRMGFSDFLRFRAEERPFGPLGVLGPRPPEFFGLHSSKRR